MGGPGWHMNRVHYRNQRSEMCKRDRSPSSSELEVFRPKGVVHATHWLLPDVPAHPAHCVIVVAQLLLWDSFRAYHQIALCYSGCCLVHGGWTNHTLCQ